MPSIPYQFRVNPDTHSFLFETLNAITLNERSEYIREKLEFGIRASSDRTFVVAPSVTHEKSDDVLPSPSVSKPHTGGFSQREVSGATEKLNADPLVGGNTKPVLPLPTGLTPAEILRRRKAEAAEKLRRSGDK